MTLIPQMHHRTLVSERHLACDKPIATILVRICGVVAHRAIEVSSRGVEGTHSSVAEFPPARGSLSRNILRELSCRNCWKLDVST